MKEVEDAQRRELGLPKAIGSVPRRITERGSLEIQAYDEVCFPGLVEEWASLNGQRPFVGTLTMESPTDADDEVRRGLPPEHRRSSWGLAACRSNLPPRCSP